MDIYLTVQTVSSKKITLFFITENNTSHTRTHKHNNHISQKNVVRGANEVVETTNINTSRCIRMNFVANLNLGTPNLMFTEFHRILIQHVYMFPTLVSECSLQICHLFYELNHVFCVIIFWIVVFGLKFFMKIHFGYKLNSAKIA